MLHDSRCSSLRGGSHPRDRQMYIRGLSASKGCEWAALQGRGVPNRPRFFGLLTPRCVRACVCARAENPAYTTFRVDLPPAARASSPVWEPDLLKWGDARTDPGRLAACRLYLACLVVLTSFDGCASLGARPVPPLPALLEYEASWAAFFVRGWNRVAPRRLSVWLLRFTRG